MAKKLNSLWRLLLGSFIALLGFGSCKTTKKVQTDERVVLYGPPPAKVERPTPSQEIRPLYGVPPVRMEKEAIP